MKITNIPWVDKYRPTKLDDIIQQDETVKILKNMIIQGNVPHLLFYGPPGTGKTSSIYAFAYELFKDKVYDRILELNASDERGISIVRNKITKFAKSTVGGSNKILPIKIIILDEADAMTHEAQSALRKLMEVMTNTRFCFICNYKSQIIEPIESRCVCFRFKSISDNILSDKLINIANRENIKINKDVANTICKIAEGDARRGIMILHNMKYIYNGCELTVEDVKKITGYIDNLDINFNKFRDYSVVEINKIVEELINNGYPLNYLLDNIKEKIIELKIAENKKADILLYLANIDVLLIEKGNEYIQLLALLVYIKRVISL